MLVNKHLRKAQEVTIANNVEMDAVGPVCCDAMLPLNVFQLAKRVKHFPTVDSLHARMLFADPRVYWSRMIATPNLGERCGVPFTGAR